MIMRFGKWMSQLHFWMRIFMKMFIWHNLKVLNLNFFPIKYTRIWNIHFDEITKYFDLIKNMDDLSVYRKISGNKVVFLILYVDDILLIENYIPLL